MFAINSTSDVLRQLLCLHHYDKGTRSNMWLFKNTEVIIEWLIYHMGTDNLLQVNQNVCPY